LTILRAQNKTESANKASPWDAYVATTIVQQKETVMQQRMIPLRPLDATVDQTIPRKVLQQELTNERSYPSVKVKRQSEKPKVARAGELGLSDTFQEIIPRMSNFPMQGKTV